MMTTTVQELRKQLTSVYATHNMNEHLSDIDCMLSHILAIKKNEIILKGNDPLPERKVTRILSIAKKRMQRIPLQYILKTCNFFGLELTVSPETLIPRPETELLVEHVLTSIQKDSSLCRILDIGTGSGNIPLALACNAPQVEVTSIDISEKALAVARKNIKKYNLGERIHLLRSDLFGALGETCFDIIVSNPPYIPEKDKETLQKEVRDYEPALSLFGGNDGLFFIKKILQQASLHLRQGGKLFLEIGYNQAKKVISTIDKNLFTAITIYKDYNGFDRIVTATRI